MVACILCSRRSKLPHVTHEWLCRGFPLVSVGALKIALYTQGALDMFLMSHSCYSLAYRYHIYVTHIQMMRYTLCIIIIIIITLLGEMHVI